MNAFDFPGVTICNLNKVHCSNLAEHIANLRQVRNPDQELTERIEGLCSIFLIGR